MKVWVTSVNTGAGISILKSLQMAQKDGFGSFEIIGSDLDRFTAGPRLANKSIQSPKYDHPEYIDFILHTYSQEKIDCIIPTYSKEIEHLSKNLSTLKKNNIKILISNYDSVSLCHDKSRFALSMNDLGIRVPKHYKTNEAIELLLKGVSLFAKPNSGSGSRGTMIVNCVEDLEYAIRKNSGTLVQELIIGKEFTVDVFCNSRSEVLVISARERLQVKSGQTTKGITTDNSPFIDTVTKICKTLKLVGPLNFQFMLDENNNLTLIEINPRLASGGTMLTVTAGANIPLLVVKESMGLPITKEECVVKTGVGMAKFSDEIYWTL